MKALAFSGWPAALAFAVCMAAFLWLGQASAQTGSAELFAEAAQPGASDWLLATGLAIPRRKMMRLEEWAETISPGGPPVRRSQDGDLQLFAQAEQESTTAGHRWDRQVELGQVPMESVGLEELRAELDELSEDARARSQKGKFFDRLLDDQLNFYSPESLLMVGGGLAVGGLMANTSLDRNIQRHLQSSLHHANTDEWLESLHANKQLGDGTLTLPIFAGAWIAGSLLPESRGSEVARTWGENSLRGFLVGAPPLLALQFATGGSRPGETAHGSEWQPFHDENGVSGHSFMGALPFITAAKMTDSVGWKTAFYAASTLAPLSRVADGAHYPSQIALGWWMAYISASAVHATGDPNARWRIFPTTVAGGSGMALEYRF